MQQVTSTAAGKFPWLPIRSNPFHVIISSIIYPDITRLANGRKNYFRHLGDYITHAIEAKKGAIVVSRTVRSPHSKTHLKKHLHKNPALLVFRMIQTNNLKLPFPDRNVQHATLKTYCQRKA